jgi:hypothetical protein
VATLNSGEVRVSQHPVAGRGTDGDRRPWAVSQMRPSPSQARTRAPGSGWTGGQSTVKPPLGLGPGAGRELTRGPHGLLPLWRDPGPVTLPRVGRLRPSLTPGHTRGPRGQGPGWTNPGSGKPRADARIQNPSGTPPRPRITRSELGDCGLTRPAGHVSRPAKHKGMRPRQDRSRYATGARFAGALTPRAQAQYGAEICITPQRKLRLAKH